MRLLFMHFSYLRVPFFIHLLQHVCVRVFLKNLYIYIFLSTNTFESQRLLVFRKQMSWFRERNYHVCRICICRLSERAILIEWIAFEGISRRLLHTGSLRLFYVENLGRQIQIAIHAYIHSCMLPSINAYIYTCIHKYTCLHNCIHTNIQYLYTYIHTYIQAFMHEYINSYLHTYICRCIGRHARENAILA